MNIDFSKLKAPTIEDCALFEKVLTEGASQSCEKSFTNIFTYTNLCQMQYLQYEDRIVIYDGVGRSIHYPLGRWTEPAELQEISLAFAREGLTDGGIYDVPEEFLDHYGDCDVFFEFEYDEGAIDYLYSVEKIATFNGPKLRKKHNLVKQFQTHWPHAAVHKIDNSNIHIAAKLATELNSRMVQCQFLDEEAEVMDLAWNNFEELNLGGIILYAEPDFPAGFSVYSMLSGTKTANIHFEKADHTVKGAPQTLTWQLAIHLRNKAAFMNREQDMNEKTLRHAKRSLDPERFFKRYFLRSKMENI